VARRASIFEADKPPQRDQKPSPPPSRAPRYSRRGSGIKRIARREMVGYSLNVRDEGNGRDEFADRLGKASTMPAQHTGGAAAGWMVQEHQQGGAPSVSAAAPAEVDRLVDSRIGRTKSGNDITPQASAAPVSEMQQRCRDVSASRRRPGRAVRTSAAADSR